MDATENDIPSLYQVRGFPTIFFVPKNDKSNPRKYEVGISVEERRTHSSIDSLQGGREVNDFIKYLARESTEPLTGYDRNGAKKAAGKAGAADL